MAKKRSAKSEFVICVRNSDYAASLELRKVYRLIPDAAAESRHLARVIDESGEDYLYPESLFVHIALPRDAENAFAHAS